MRNALKGGKEKVFPVHHKLEEFLACLRSHHERSLREGGTNKPRSSIRRFAMKKLALRKFLLLIDVVFVALPEISLGHEGGDRLLDSADVVITIGYDPVEYPPGDWNRNSARKVIHIDVLPTDLDNSYRPYAELTGDITSTLNLLTPQLKRTHRSDCAAMILKEIAAERAELGRESASRGGTPIHPLRLVAELQPLLSSDVTLCLDMGSFHLWLARHLYSFKARQILISNGQQTLGVAMPWAIAASIVRPSEKVIAISGDGGFLFSAMELETAVRLNANIVQLVWIDGTMTWSPHKKLSNMAGSRESLWGLSTWSNTLRLSELLAR
jgi:thiamine pyrophosphate-dependent acetolactate synthase large subunit-like protein